MRIARSLNLNSVLIVVLGGISVLPLRLTAQISPSILTCPSSQGRNAIWGTCTGTLGVVGSSAFVDATVFGGPGIDFCQQINNAINSLPLTGGVVDARGVQLSGGNTCANSPFTNPNVITVPSIVLLPPGIITVSKTWVLPDETKVIGEGSGASGTSVTTLRATTSFSGTWMIQMGPNSGPLDLCTTRPAGHCVGVALEDVALQGASGVSGIINGQSQDQSYVRGVNLYQIPGTGLRVWNSAQNSGPYTDIRFDTGDVSGISQAGTICAQLSVPSYGLHGLTCISNAIPQAAVLVDSSNNSIEDIRVQGFIDGIAIGTNGSAQSDIVMNATGGSGVTHLINIETAHTVSDLSIVGITRGLSDVTILDNLTSTTLSDEYVGTYVLGESILIDSNTAYSRFTTSPNVPTLGVGTSTPTSTTCTKGSLFSDAPTLNSGGDLYVCTGGTTWSPL
jgi:hypothetical protein